MFINFRNYLNSSTKSVCLSVYVSIINKNLTKGCHKIQVAFRLNIKQLTDKGENIHTAFPLRTLKHPRRQGASNTTWTPTEKRRTERQRGGTLTSNAKLKSNCSHRNIALYM